MTLTGEADLVGGSGINRLLSVMLLTTADYITKFRRISCARDFPCILQRFFSYSDILKRTSSYILVSKKSY